MLTLVRCGGGSVRTRKRVYPFEVAPTASELGNPELCPEGFSPEPPGAWAKRVRREREGLLVPALPSRLSTRAATCGRQVDGLQQQLLQQPQAERGYEAPDNGHPNNDSRQAKEHSFRISRFLEMCHRHEDFIKNSVVIDSYLLAMASLYLKRAGLNAKGYTKDRYFFYALYLAIETEEDLPRGAEEILIYLLGPCGVAGPTGKSPQQIQWEKRLNRFLTGKDKFWARLDYRTWLTEEKCRKEMNRFPKQDRLVHRQRELSSFCA